MRRLFAVLLTSEPVQNVEPPVLMTATARPVSRHGSLSLRQTKSMLHEPDFSALLLPRKPSASPGAACVSDSTGVTSQSTIASGARPANGLKRLPDVAAWSSP